MENVRVTNQIDTIRSDNDKTITSFVKDAPKITRYSLADSADGSNSGMDYHLEIINKDDKLKVLKFLRRFFFRDEPLNHSIKLIPEGENSTCAELEAYCTSSSLENNLSLMAVSANGAIVGIQLNGKVVTVGFSRVLDKSLRKSAKYLFLILSILFSIIFIFC